MEVADLMKGEGWRAWLTTADIQLPEVADLIHG